MPNIMARDNNEQVKIISGEKMIELSWEKVIDSELYKKRNYKSKYTKINPKKMQIAKLDKS